MGSQEGGDSDIDEHEEKTGNPHFNKRVFSQVLELIIVM